MKAKSAKFSDFALAMLYGIAYSMGMQEKRIENTNSPQGQERKMDAKLTWQVVEDNGGGLHLAVWEDGRLIYVHNGYEYWDGFLFRDLIALSDGSHPINDDWENNDINATPWDWDAESRRNGGWSVIVDDYNVKPWGAASHTELLRLRFDERFAVRRCTAGCDKCAEAELA